jgi:hypothetical protein
VTPLLSSLWGSESDSLSACVRRYPWFNCWDSVSSETEIVLFPEIWTFRGLWL